MGNSGRVKFREPLEELVRFPNEMVAEHARWALEQLGGDP
jgi:epoxyqueuosine reductase QueG